VSPFTVRFAAAFLVLLAAAVGLHNMSRPLANPDEGRYSEISREMEASSDWVTPRLNGVKYFEKPPLQYWATALAFRFFGENEYTARLYVALAGLATLLLVGFTASRVGSPGGTGFAAMLALVASPYFMMMGGVVTLDTGLALWTTVTLCAYLLAERPGLRPALRRRWMLLAWAGMACAVLSKGLVGIVFPVAAVGLHCLLHRDFAPLRRLEWLRGLAVLVVIAAPWFVLVSRANPEFAHFFFVHEHFERFLTTQHRRTEPAWFFVPILFAGFLPWLAALPGAMLQSWRMRPRRGEISPWRFALLWGLFVVGFFSLSGSKLPGYILPAFPAFGLALGLYLSQARTATLGWQALASPIAAIAVAVAAWRLPASAHDDWTRALYLAAQPWAYFAAAWLGLAGVATMVLLFRGRRWQALVVAAAGTVMLIECVVQGYDEVAPRQSGREVAQAAAALLRPDTRLYSVHYYEQTVPFYLGRTMTLVDYVDEFELGQKSEPRLAIPRLADFPAEWLRPGEAAAIMHPDTFHSLRDSGLPMQVVHEDPRRVLVRKP
jgi:4-amino-4-deoxy-L-arabinose transferase-like glycosyltransferase